ncbi:unnamed protein product [Paramecium pentaurelia]|uniref:Uncharacterized protein n=1 Tax=Paramecium pentaurelia TaxID=43138 RepID=A0A8S1THB8_9CILI|nr:unnamed protein product [Paramecium pentaurelia]
MNSISFQQLDLRFIQQRQGKDLNVQMRLSDDQYICKILPLRIQNFEIKRLELKDCNYKPDVESLLIAHCY